jgi:hypothetical protein
MPGRKNTVTGEPAAHVTAAVLGIAQGATQMEIPTTATKAMNRMAVTSPAIISPKGEADKTLL